MRMYADVKFDREINRDLPYIFFGGFVMTFAGEKFHFDFYEYYGKIDDKDKTVLHCEFRCLDTDSFPESEGMLDKLDKLESIDEFYIYTGEEVEDEEINPVSVLWLALEDDNIVTYEADKRIIENIAL